MQRTLLFLFFLYAIGIFLFHGLPMRDLGLNEIETGPFRATDLLHVAVFFPWGVLGAFFVHLRPTGRFRRALGWLVLGLFLAFVGEGIQYWLPHRSFNWSDMGFNLAGVVLGSPAMLFGGLGRRSGGITLEEEKVKS